MSDVIENARHLVRLFKQVGDSRPGPGFRRLRELNLGWLHLRALDSLDPDRTRSMKELADELQRTPPSMMMLARRLVETGRDVGIDVGIASLITTSDGDKSPNPAWYRHELRRLRVAQRRVARRMKGSANRLKAVTQLARRAERVANTRKDFLNKLAHELVAQYDRIAVEALCIPNLVKIRHLAQSILDASWGYLVARLHSKAEEAGRMGVMISRGPSISPRS